MSHSAEELRLLTAIESIAVALGDIAQDMRPAPGPVSELAQARVQIQQLQRQKKELIIHIQSDGMADNGKIVKQIIRDSSYGT